MFKRIFIIVFFEENKQTRRQQVFLGGGRGEFFKKEPIAPQYIVRSSHRKVVYEIAALHLWSKTLKIRFKDVYIQVSSTFQTNLGVTIHKKHQEELNRYVLFTTPIHHRNVMLTHI